MKHLRWLPPGEWPQVPVDPEDPDAGERDATEHELLQMDLVPVAEHPEGGWIVDCLGREGREYPGDRISDGPWRVRGGRGRFEGLPGDVALRCFRQRVVRDESPGPPADVRGDAGAARGGAPPIWTRICECEDGVIPEEEYRRPDPPEMVEEARRRAADPGRPERERRVSVADVRDEDVVVDDPEPGHRWAGEP